MVSLRDSMKWVASETKPNNEASIRKQTSRKIRPTGKSSSQTPWIAVLLDDSGNSPRSSSLVLWASLLQTRFRYLSHLHTSSNLTNLISGTGLLPTEIRFHPYCIFICKFIEPTDACKCCMAAEGTLSMQWRGMRLVGGLTFDGGVGGCGGSEGIIDWA